MGKKQEELNAIFKYRGEYWNDVKANLVDANLFLKNKEHCLRDIDAQSQRVKRDEAVWRVESDLYGQVTLEGWEADKEKWKKKIHLDNGVELGVVWNLLQNYSGEVTWKEIFNIGKLLNNIDNITAVSSNFNHGVAVESKIIAEFLVTGKNCNEIIEKLRKLPSHHHHFFFISCLMKHCY